MEENTSQNIFFFAAMHIVTRIIEQHEQHKLKFQAINPN